MMSYFKLFFYYKLALLKNIFGSSAPSAFNDSIKTNFRDQSYRYPEKATKDLFICFKVFKTIFLSQLRKTEVKFNRSSSGIALFDGDIRHAQTRFDYVKYLSGDDAKVLIGRSQLLNSPSPLISLFTILLSALWFPFILPLSLFSKNKLRYPLHFLGTIEAFHLLYLLKFHGINKLHFFCIYENDANLLAYSLMKSKIFINKITSEAPLSVWNKCIVADTVSFCFQYQEEEYNLFRSTMHVNAFQHWIPEASVELIPIYLNKRPEIIKNTIGFYSSAMWLREKTGRVDLKIDAVENENKLLSYLLNFINENKKYKLTLFLHPLEKQNIKEAMEYYKGLNPEIEIADASLKNSFQFFNADVVVTLYSTLLFERLFWGFKTLIMPMGLKDFPIKGSFLNTICCIDEKDLKNKLSLAIEQDTNTFFSKNNISACRYSEYEIFKSH